MLARPTAIWLASILTKGTRLSGKGSLPNRPSRTRWPITSPPSLAGMQIRGSAFVVSGPAGPISDGTMSSAPLLIVSVIRSATRLNFSVLQRDRSRFRLAIILGPLASVNHEGAAHSHGKIQGYVDYLFQKGRHVLQGPQGFVDSGHPLHHELDLLFLGHEIEQIIGKEIVCRWSKRTPRPERDAAGLSSSPPLKGDISRELSVCARVRSGPRSV